MAWTETSVNTMICWRVSMAQIISEPEPTPEPTPTEEIQNRVYSSEELCEATGITEARFKQLASNPEYKRMLGDQRLGNLSTGSGMGYLPEARDTFVTHLLDKPADKR